MKPRLAQELRQDKPFGGLEEVVFLNVLRTADALLQGELAILAEHNLSFAQYNVLRVLRGAGREGLTCGAIAERLVNRDPDVTRLLDRLEKAGWVTRQRDATDRRVVVATLAAEGRALLKTLDAPIARVHRDQLAHMSKTHLQTLAALLEEARVPH